MTVLKNILPTIRSRMIEQEEFFTYVMLVINGEEKEYISASLVVIEYRRKGSTTLERALVNQLSLYEKHDSKPLDENTISDESFDIINRYGLKNMVYYNVRSGETLLPSEIEVKETIDFRELFPVKEGCRFDEKEIDEELKVLQIK